MKQVYWLQLQGATNAYRVDQDRYLMIKERAGSNRESTDFEGVLPTNQTIKGWVEVIER